MTSDADWQQHSQPEPAQQEQARQAHSETSHTEARGDGAEASGAGQAASPPEPVYRGDGGVQVRSYTGQHGAGGNGYDAASEPAAAMAVAEVETAGVPIDFEYNEDVPGYEPGLGLPQPCASNCAQPEPHKSQRGPPHACADYGSECAQAAGALGQHQRSPRDGDAASRGDELEIRAAVGAGHALPGRISRTSGSSRSRPHPSAISGLRSAI